jgi:lipoprotein-releasing system ATP-binding protein
MKLQSLSKSFFSPSKIDLFSNISLEVSPGETVAIIGRSGSGKSTLLQIIGLLESPTSGQVIFPYSESKELVRRRHIGFIFQGFYLFEDETALSNVLFPAKIDRKQAGPKSGAYERAVALLEEVGLSDRLNFPVRLLSGGEKQRVAIARALMNDPALILADEPTGNLDEQNAKIVQDLLISCCKKHRKSLILATHDLGFAKRCDKIYELSNGTLN